MSPQNPHSISKNETFDLLFYNNPNPMWIYELDTLKFLNVNNSAVLTYGYTKDEFLQKKISDIRPKEDIPKLSEHLKERQIPLRPSFNWRHRYKDGTIVYVDILSHDIEFNGKKACLITVNNVTEKVKILEALKKSEERYRALFEFAGSGIAYCDLNGKLVLINETGAKYFGGIPADFQGKYLKDFLPGSLAQSIENTLTEVNKTKRNFEKEEYSECNNEPLVYLINYQPLFDTGNNVEGVQLIFQDVTGSKKIEKALRESETRFRRLFEDILQVPVQGYDSSHRVIFWNKASENAYGYTREEAMGQKMEDLIIPDHMRVDVYNAIEDFYKKDIHIPSGEIGLKRKDGSIINMYSSHVLIKNYSGNKEMYCVDLDMSKRIEAEKRVALQARMLNAVGQAVIATDLNGKIIYLNSAAEKLYGWTKEEVLNKYITENISSALNKKDAENIIKKLRNGEQSSEEFYGQKKNGYVFPIYSTNTPLYNSRNELVGIIGVSIDISDIKNKENELKAAKNKAEEMSKIKSAFLTNMSHELRTPLVGILGFSEILNEELQEPDYKNLAGSIVLSGKRLLSTLNAIIDLSKIESNMMELSYSTVNVLSEIETISETFKGLASKKGLSLIIESDEIQDFSAELDKGIFRQILENLIHNAIKFTEQGDVKITVIKGTGTFTLKIKDSGIGIPPNALDIIFSEFRQVSEGYGRHFDGTGIGLTLTKKFVELLNGSINVESELNEGTIFTIRFPLTKNILLKQKLLSDDEKLLLDNKGNTKMNLKILLVEDDAINREVICRYLKNNFDVTIAENGNEAMKQATINKYGLILMDINLGKGLNGIETARKIKELAEYSDVPIVALTAYAMKGDKENFLASGFSDYLSKPFLKEDLLFLISSLFPAE